MALPGPYARYAIDTLGPEGFLALINQFDPEGRAVHYAHCLCYVDEQGKITTFYDEYRGTFSLTISDELQERAWCSTDKIFIPLGSDKVMSEMGEDDFKAVEKIARPMQSNWDQLVEHLSTQESLAKAS